jgi:hypothetical protein
MQGFFNSTQVKNQAQLQIFEHTYVSVSEIIEPPGPEQTAPLDSSAIDAGVASHVPKIGRTL